MLTKKQIAEVREHLEKAQNPLFYYDNDADGLCSFLLARRFLGRGKGVAVKSYPDLNAQYAKRAQELNADYVFILDKPVLSQEFLQEIDTLQLPVVWVDHHDVDSSYIKKFQNIQLYNPTKNKGKNKSSEPVTFLMYSITQRVEDMWIAMMGCIADHFLPPFAKEFKKQYPSWWGEVKEPFDAYYRTEIGRIAQSLSFGLKDSVTNVVHLQNFLANARTPDDVFAEIETNESFRTKYHEIRKKYDSLITNAQESTFGKLIFFDYSGDLSISAELSNELSYRNPEKYIAVAYLKGAISNVSLRGKNIKDILEKLLKKFENATGGGHQDAVGARIQTADLAKFRELLQAEVNKNE